VLEPPNWATWKRLSTHARNRKRREPETPCYGRVWIDTPTGRIRQTVPLGNHWTRTLARQHMREYIEKQGINALEHFDDRTTPASTFEQQANHWLESLPTRRRKPVKPATVAGWRHCLDRGLTPNLGALSLSEVLRRYRTEVLRRARAPEVLDSPLDGTRQQFGHGPLRRRFAKRCGLST
jgi:hypothetical protein